MPGPLPNRSRRRRNAPTFPTTSLPVTGRTGPIPKPPRDVHLGVAGRAWWRWAWRTPQAAAWNSGVTWAVARRAQMEDAWAAKVEAGEVTAALANAMRELEDRLGLTPKGMQALRWEIVPVAPAESEADEDDERDDEVASRRAAREKRLGAAES